MDLHRAVSGVDQWAIKDYKHEPWTPSKHWWKRRANKTARQNLKTLDEGNEFSWEEVLFEREQVELDRDSKRIWLNATFMPYGLHLTERLF